MTGRRRMVVIMVKRERLQGMRAIAVGAGLFLFLLLLLLSPRTWRLPLMEVYLGNVRYLKE